MPNFPLMQFRYLTNEFMSTAVTTNVSSRKPECSGYLLPVRKVAESIPNQIETKSLSIRVVFGVTRMVQGFIVSLSGTDEYTGDLVDNAVPICTLSYIFILPCAHCAICRLCCIRIVL